MPFDANGVAAELPVKFTRELFPSAVVFPSVVGVSIVFFCDLSLLVSERDEPGLAGIGVVNSDESRRDLVF